MKRVGLLVGSIALFCLFVGCSKGDDPKNVAEKFWEAARAGKSAEVKQYVTKSSYKMVENQNDGGEVTSGGFSLGEPKVENNKATIPTTIKDSEMSMELVTVLVKEDGKWKVDMGETMMSMLGGAMGEMMEGLEKIGEGMDDIASGAKDMEDRVEKDIQKTEEKKEDTESKSDVPASKSFSVGDAVKVEWRGSWWDASVIEVGDNKWKINYDGYSSSWDEWVGPDRIKKK